LINIEQLKNSPQVLWRQKEQFSDGVGYSWIDQLKLEAERTVTDLQMKFAASRFPQSTPLTKVNVSQIFWAPDDMVYALYFEKPARAALSGF